MSPYLPEYVDQIWLRSDGRVGKKGGVQTDRHTKKTAALYSRLAGYPASLGGREGGEGGGGEGWGGRGGGREGKGGRGGDGGRGEGGKGGKGGREGRE